MEKEETHNQDDDQPNPSPKINLTNNNDRLKRDEWSEGAVSCLLEAYEAKWVLRNRAKLKGHDWEDVARHVSSRGTHSSKSPKTQTQCKNKIESMKKRYRSESATAADGSSSSWPLYPRLELLLRGSTATHPQPVTTVVTGVAPTPLMIMEPAVAVSSPPMVTQLQPPPQNSLGSDGVDRNDAKEEGSGMKLSDHASDKNPLEIDSSTPALYSDKEKLRSKRLKRRIEKKTRRRRQEVEIAESIRWLAEVVVRSEQSRMETMREIERMRVEAEGKRGEMDLKRTEILAKTQLEIARILAAGVGKGVDSSLRIGRS